MPTTPEGKAVSSLNATKHGILSKRLFLHDESPDEFAALQDDLRRALRPVGAYELLLVERMAVTIWRQRRLIRAETAGIELRRVDRNRDVKKAVEFAMSEWITDEGYEPVTDDDREREAWCRTALAELDRLEADPRDATADILREYPTVYEQAKTDAEGVAVEQHYRSTAKLAEYLTDLQSWCRRELSKIARREIVARVYDLAKATQDAPITDELLTRYTTALDNDLVKIARELRDAQAWRRDTVSEVPAGGAVETLPVAA